MIKKTQHPGILLKKYFGKLLMGFALMTMLMPAGTGTASASGLLPDGLSSMQQRVITGTVAEVTELLCLQSVSGRKVQQTGL